MSKKNITEILDNKDYTIKVIKPGEKIENENQRKLKELKRKKKEEEEERKKKKMN